MIKSLKLFVVSLILSSCATVEVPNIKAWVELPASGDGYAVETVSKKAYRMPAKQWQDRRRRAIHVFAEDWAVLKKTIIKNCITNRCKQSVGALDGLFLAIDDALKKVGGQ